MGGNECRNFSTLNGGSFGMHASGSEEGMRGAMFPLALLPINIYGLDEEGNKIMPPAPNHKARAFSTHVRGSGARARQTFCFAPFPVQLSWTGWGG